MPFMPLTRAQIESAIMFNQAHAIDVLPAIERELGRTVPHPGQGQWHAEAVQHLAQLQKAAEITPDGQFGPGSRMALCDCLRVYPTEGMWPAPDSEERGHWSAMCEIMGFPLAPGRHTLIGLRGVSLNALFTHPSASRAAYDDTFVWLGGDGSSVRRFSGATHAYQARSENMGDDIDGDGRSDIATIRPGRYIGTQPHRFHGKVALDVYNLDGTNHIPAFRDVDGDRGISNSDKNLSEQTKQGAQVNEQGAYARGVKFHPGFDTKHAQGAFSSVGCQTAPLAEIERLHAAKEFDYVLLDAVEVLVYLGRFD
jgi:hypothetical protein